MPSVPLDAIGPKPTLPPVNDPISGCIYAPDAPALIAKYKTWATNCLSAAQSLATAEFELGNVKLTSGGCGMEGPGASTLQTDVVAVVGMVGRVGATLGDAEYGFRALARKYAMAAQVLGDEWRAYQSAEQALKAWNTKYHALQGELGRGVRG